MKRLKNKLIGLLCILIMLPITLQNNVYADMHTTTGTLIDDYLYVSDYFKIKNCDYVSIDIYYCKDSGTTSSGDYGGSSCYGDLYIIDMDGTAVASIHWTGGDTDGSKKSKTISLQVPAELRTDSGYYAIKFQGYNTPGPYIWQSSRRYQG